MVKQFSMLRAAFWLLAGIICVQMLITVMGMATCMALLLGDKEKLGACEGLGTQIREVWSEALAAILALLLAARETMNGVHPPTIVSEVELGKKEPGT